MEHARLILWVALLITGCLLQDPDCLNDRSLDRYCQQPNTTSDALCNGRGECVCGVCACHSVSSLNSHRRFTGTFCQCDDYSCDYYYGELCGGVDRGRCNCGVCDCTEGYEGDTCECPKSNESCMTPYGTLCNNRGDCECGVCKCWPDSSYRGPTCEECPTCPGRCSESKECVLCKAFGTGNYDTEECYSKCNNFNIHEVDTVDPENFEDNEYLCQFKDHADDCRFFFTYQYTSVKTGLVLRVQKTKACPRSNLPGGGVTGINHGVAATVLGGLGFIVLHRIAP